jgi:aldose sugar dehydrogenase
LRRQKPQPSLIDKKPMSKCVLKLTNLFRLWFVLAAGLSLLLGGSYSNQYVNAEVEIKDSKLKVETVAEGLRTPTAMAFLGHQDILVLEKTTGKVQRIIDGKIQDEPVLDVDPNISYEGERGMLGLTITKDNRQDNEKNVSEDESNRRYVFLFYTETTGESFDENCRDCPVEAAISRLYRYEFKGGKLVNPELLLTIPIGRDRIHIGGALALDSDNNVYLISGDRSGCRDYDSCSTLIETGNLNSETANKQNGSKPTGSGGILRVTWDGNMVNGKDTPDDADLLNFYYAYGIRNSFGIDFDPVTGNLWDTENGPGFGDEINLVKPGFNSGWAKVQGIWPVSEISQLSPIQSQMGYIGSEAIPTSIDLADLNSYGKYSHPEFTWNIPVAVTSIKFLNSDKLGKEYENDLFVGDHKNGRLYHFELNENRTELVLNETLNDKVADSDTELKDVILGNGFNSITDIEVGPDGYLYILSIYEGKIFRIVPELNDDRPEITTVLS